MDQERHSKATSGGRRKRRAGDLRPDAFPEMSWAGGDVEASLHALYRYAEAEALKANDWYLQKKRRKRPLGQWLRGVAIVLIAGAGLVPILSELWQTGGNPVIRPGISPLLIGVAALLLFLDRFLGATSSWMRFLSASQLIEARLRQFRFDWARQQAALQGKPPDAVQIQRLIGLCHGFLADVDRIVQEETQIWAQEFRSILRQIDEAAGQAAQPRRSPGAIEITLTNGDRASGPWRVRLDDGVEYRFTGTRALLPEVSPGPRRLTVTGEIDGKPAQSEANIEVPQATTQPVTLTLS